MSNQLVSASSYNVKNMIFSEPQVGNIPGGSISFKRINIQTKYEDGTIGDLIIPTSEVFSFGIGETTDMATKALNGYSMSLALWNKNGATEEEKEWTDTFNSVVEHAKKYVLDHKDDIEKYDLEPANLKKFNPLYWKRDKGKIVEGSGPTLYAKLIVSKKEGIKITSIFYDEQGNTLDPVSLIGKYAHVKAAIKIESIFVGKDVSLQVKLYEAEVRLIQTGMQSLMRTNRPTPQKLVSSATTESRPLQNTVDEDGDEDVVEEEAPKPVQPATVKKVIKKVIKKVEG
jgi:hypothetical protein